MKIGIIGAGNIGTLTRRLTALGHDVSVANSRRPETLADLAAETAATAENAVNGAELVGLTIPVACVSELPASLFDRLRPARRSSPRHYYASEEGRIAESAPLPTEWNVAAQHAR